jgi:hypothetical protein
MGQELNEINVAHFDYRANNKIQDNICLDIFVTSDFRSYLLSDTSCLGGAYWQETGGRKPVEYLFGQRLYVDDTQAESYRFAVNPEATFHVDPHHGGAES